MNRSSFSVSVTMASDPPPQLLFSSKMSVLEKYLIFNLSKAAGVPLYQMMEIGDKTKHEKFQ